MALPLLQYNPSSQNHRVASFGVADQNEDTPYIYRIEDVSSYTDMTNIIWLRGKNHMERYTFSIYQKESSWNMLSGMWSDTDFSKDKNPMNMRCK